MHSLTALLSALGVVVACYSAGKLITVGRCIAWPAQTVLGMAALSSVFFLLLALRLGRPAVFLMTAGAVIVISLVQTRPRRRFNGRFALPVYALVLLGAYGLFYLPHAMAPEIAYDGMGYHLALPAEWLRIGGFPSRIGFYELLPQGMETIYALALAGTGNSVAAKLVHFFCLIATVALLQCVGRQMLLPAWAAPVAAVVFVACPVAGMSATSAYSDIAFTLSILAAFYLARDAWTTPSAAGWALAGLAAGFCYAVKLPGLLVPGALLFILLWSRKWKPAITFAAGASVTVLPWMGRALLLTGNPMAPLMNTLFPNLWFPPETDAELRRVFHFDSAGGFHGIRLPLELAFRGGQLGLIGPLVLTLPLGVLAAFRKQTRTIAAAGAVLLIIYTLNLSARFLLPSFLFLVLAIAASLPKRWSQGLAMAAAIACWPHLAAVYSDAGTVLVHWPYRVALGIESPRLYLHQRVPIYPFAEQTRNHVPPGSTVFDCAGLPAFYSRVVTVQFWQTRDLWGLYQRLLDRVNKEASQEPGRYFAQRGVRYISMDTGTASKVPWAAGLMNAPAEWGFRLAGAIGDYRLYEVSDSLQPEHRASALR